jgi:hypothetical protein
MRTYSEDTNKRANTCIPGNTQPQKLQGVYGWREPDSKSWRSPCPEILVIKKMPTRSPWRLTSIKIPHERMIDDRNFGGPIFRIKIVDGGWNVT